MIKDWKNICSDIPCSVRSTLNGDEEAVPGTSMTNAERSATKGAPDGGLWGGEFGGKRKGAGISNPAASTDRKGMFGIVKSSKATTQSVTKSSLLHMFTKENETNKLGIAPDDETTSAESHSDNLDYDDDPSELSETNRPKFKGHNLGGLHEREIRSSDGRTPSPPTHAGVEEDENIINSSNHTGDINSRSSLSEDVLSDLGNPEQHSIAEDESSNSNMPNENNIPSPDEEQDHMESDILDGTKTPFEGNTSTNNIPHNTNHHDDVEYNHTDPDNIQDPLDDVLSSVTSLDRSYDQPHMAAGHPDSLDKQTFSYVYDGMK